MLENNLQYTLSLLYRHYVITDENIRQNFTCTLCLHQITCMPLKTSPCVRGSHSSRTSERISTLCTGSQRICNAGLSEQNRTEQSSKLLLYLKFCRGRGNMHRCMLVWLYCVPSNCKPGVTPSRFSKVLSKSGAVVLKDNNVARELFRFAFETRCVSTKSQNLSSVERRKHRREYISPRIAEFSNT